MVRVIPMAVGPTGGMGVIGTDVAVGGGDFTVPVWAKSVLGFSLAIGEDVNTTANVGIARANLTSNNAPIQPFHALAAPIGPVLGAATETSHADKPEKYDMNLRVNGGEQITPNIRAMTTMTVPYATEMFLISDATASEPQRHITVGTSTLTAVTNNTETNGTAYSISSAKNVVELYGVAGQVTTTGGEGYGHRMRFQSAEFAGVNTADLLMPGVNGALTNLIAQSIPGVARQKCNIPIQPVSQCNIQDSYVFLSAANLAVGVTFVSGVQYEV